MFNVNGVLVDTIREVCEVLGTKVSKKDVMSGKVDGVTMVDDTVYEEGITESVEEVAEEIAEKELVEEGSMELPISEEVPAPIIEEVPSSLIEEVPSSLVEEVAEENTKSNMKVLASGAGKSNTMLAEAMAAIKATEAEDTRPPYMRPLVATPVKSNVVTLKPNIALPKGAESVEEVKPTENLDALRNKLKQVYDKKVAENPGLGKKPKEVKPKYDLTITEYPEKGSFTTPDELKKFYRQLSDAQLLEWAELEGVEFVPNDNAGILRMRLAMAITNHHFPKAVGKSKKKSKYSDYTTEQLVDMCIEHEVPVKDDKGDVRILRMYAIMALRESGIID